MPTADEGPAPGNAPGPVPVVQENDMFDPIRPYLGLIKAGAVAALLALVFVKGCQHGEARTAEKVAAKDRVIEKKNEALRDAATALRGAADRFRAIDAETQRQIDEAVAARKRAEDAGKVAQDAAEFAERRSEAFRRNLEHARNNPTCAALLSADLRKTCGL